MDSRKLMRKGEKITLIDDTTGNKKVFTIIARDGAGQSSVSYFASCGRKTGRLKEFYPSEHNYGRYLSMTREKDNQLIKTNDTYEADKLFDDMLSEYVESYHMLDDAKRNAAKGNNSFSTFIPSFEILRGCNKKDEICGSAYIWTVDNDGDFETFGEFLNKVHKNPTKNPTKDLFIILKTLYNLTECIKTLHIAGLIHSDIKPENFGFPIRGGRYLTEQVQLFDVNSIYSVYTQFPKLSGTIGFCAPEVFNGKITNQSDLYSIGATLFNAIALCDEIPDGLYNDEYYNKIDEVVAESKLLSASPITSSSKFQFAISTILKKCLAKDLKKRIDECDELKENIKKATVLLIPSQYNETLNLGCEIKIIEKELEKYNEADSMFTLQSLLFNHPIYTCNSSTIRILVFGCGVYGQQFIDLCLQAGQIINTSLEVCVLTQDKELYKKDYLDKRPALKDFFEVDGEGDVSESRYGRLRFVSPEEACNDPSFAKGFVKGEKVADKKYNKRLAQEIMINNSEHNYLFISLGDEDLNDMIAKTCRDVFDSNTTIAFVSSKNKAAKGCIPVNVSAKAEENENFSEIERMGYNAHLCWNSPLKLNINERKAYKEYKDRYYHDSSVACVLSIKYKLHSIGIELDELTDESLSMAAAKYDSFIKENDAAFADLTNIEHRRWVVEKITQGWTCKTDYFDCLQGNINDKRRKLHPCIVKSKPDFNLEAYFKNKITGRWNKAMWNAPCPEDDYLDDLDKVSVNLHRTFFEYAEQIKKSFSLKGEEYKRITFLIKEEKRAVLAFNEWMLCLQRIWDADEKQTKFYDGYKDAFLEAIKTFSKTERNEILSYVNIINSKAMPIINAYRMRDYKASDKDLVNYIPFILTHKDSTLFIPLMTGDTTERFNNVASATLINPSLITYAVYLKKYEDIKDTKDTIKHILSYFAKKDIKSKLKLILISCESDAKIGAGLCELKEDLKELDSNRINQITAVVAKDESEICACLSERINADAYESNSAYLSALLMGSGFYSARPNFSFDSARKKFSVSENCRWLKYIKGGQSLTVADMLSFKNSVGKMHSLPEYYNFDSLWKIYREKSYAWKDMCKVLEKYSETNDLIASFNVYTDLTSAKTYEFIIPNELRDGYNYVVSYLRDKLQILGRESRIEYKTTEACCAVLVVGINNIEAVRKLFYEPQKFINSKDLSIVVKPKKAEIYYDSLTVKSLKLDDYPEYAERKKKIAETLQALQSKQYIFNLKNSDNNVFSFVYSTKQAKQLMTMAGRALEIYIYHRLQKSGFDDIVSGYEIIWEDSSVKSELDCILTSGFRSVWIECKAQDKISQDCYYKLSCLTKQFGVNAVPVLIADTHERDDRDNSANETQRERGKMMGVYTIFDREEINNIDKTLKRILNGKY